MQARVVSKHAREPSAFFLAKDGNAALLRLSEERAWLSAYGSTERALFDQPEAN